MTAVEQVALDFGLFRGKDIALSLRSAGYKAWQAARPGWVPDDGPVYWNAYWGGHATSQCTDDVRFVVLYPDGRRHVVRQQHANGEVPGIDYWRKTDGWFVDDRPVSTLADLLDAIGLGCTPETRGQGGE